MLKLFREMLILGYWSVTTPCTVFVILFIVSNKSAQRVQTEMIFFFYPLLCLSISEPKEDWFHLMARDVSSTLPSSCACGFDDELRWRRLFSSWWGWRWMDNNHSSNGMTDSFPAHTAQLKCLVLQSLFTCALFARTHIYWKRDWTNWQSFSHLNHNCWEEKVKGFFFFF